MDLNVCAQELRTADIDSLLNSKRVYLSVNIGELNAPRIDGDLNDEIWSLGEWQDDFSFMQFRSNQVFRWEYKLGSALYLVWSHDRSGWEALHHPIGDIMGDLFGLRVNHVFMVKTNFWFSL